ncbi:MAG TPA: RCC1 repeat-containing protein, partial [Firmicutes bacterium]|nr:RCC1 repeat-containing protein [Bacillota bacterium]
GQLGDGTRGTYRITPVQVSGLGNIIAITAGYSHTVALKDDGTVWAWGSNSDGELGGGTTSLPRLTPGVVSDLSNVSAIIAGFYYTAALKNDGTVWA